MEIHQLQRPSPPAGQATAPEPPAAPRRTGAMIRWLALLILIAAGAAAGGWFLLRPLPVSVAAARAGPAIDAVYASGVVEYVRQARIAPVTTAPIRQVRVIEGEIVRPGQVLAQLEDGPQEGTALQLEAQAALARSQAERARRLFASGFGSKAANDDAQAQRRAAEAAAASARARLRDYQLTAPFAGTVLRREAEPGDLAQVGKPLFVVADLGSLRITADVDERDVGRLAVGLEAVVRADAYPDRTFPARIAEITPQGDATGRVFRVRLQLSPDAPLRPGMTVETNIVTGRRDNAVLVPASAVADGAVWLIKDGRARAQPVKTGAAGEEMIEIVSGLATGTNVIVDPPEGLKDGRRVAVDPARR